VIVVNKLLIILIVMLAKKNLPKAGTRHVRSSTECTGKYVPQIYFSREILTEDYRQYFSQREHAF
jgi:hypothetical protein